MTFLHYSTHSPVTCEVLGRTLTFALRQAYLRGSPPDPCDLQHGLQAALESARPYPNQSELDHIHNFCKSIFPDPSESIG